MNILIFLITGVTALTTINVPTEVPDGEEEKVWKYLQQYEQEYKPRCIEEATAVWNYDTNMTEENSKKRTELNLKLTKWLGEQSSKANKMFNWRKLKNKEQRRIMRGFTSLGISALPEKLIKESYDIWQKLSDQHAKAKICPYTRPGEAKPKPKECTLSLDPDVNNILETSNNYDELLHVWKSFFDKFGKPTKELWWRYAQIINQSSIANGYKNLAEDQLQPFSHDSPTFEQDIEVLYQQLKPLYQQVHAYVRSKLIKQFPGKIRADGPIPAHLLGHPHAQKVLRSGLEPFPGQKKLNVTETMVKKGMTPRDIFKLAEEFFTSLGLKPMTKEFWKYSVLEKPTDGREIVCHAAMYDMCGTNKTLIRQCTRIKMSDMIIAHHEMGHAQYSLQYQHLPSYYQYGANPGFHEAIGDTLTLSVFTPTHLEAIGLLDGYQRSNESTISHLMQMAFDKIFLLPSTYFYDLFRWNVYRGVYPKDKLNDKWWQMQLEYAGLCPPVRRTNDNFDPASKHHISTFSSYISYFVAQVLHFQFYEALCDAAGHKGPLHECDFYKSKAAGKRLGNMLKLGSSKPWPEVLKTITGGSGKMDARPILRYFEPLMQWLKKYNAKEHIGWKSDDANVCP